MAGWLGRLVHGLLLEVIGWRLSLFALDMHRPSTTTFEVR